MSTENNTETLMNTAIATIRRGVLPPALKGKETPWAAPKWCLLAAKWTEWIAICGLEGEHDMSASWAGQRWRAPRSYSTKEPRREVIWFSPNCLKPLAKLFYQDAQKQPEPV